MLQSEILDDNRIEFLMILYDSIYCLSLHRQHQRQNNEYIAQKKDTSIFLTEIWTIIVDLWSFFRMSKQNVGEKQDILLQFFQIHIVEKIKITLLQHDVAKFC